MHSCFLKRHTSHFAQLPLNDSFPITYECSYQVKSVSLCSVKFKNSQFIPKSNNFRCPLQ